MYILSGVLIRELNIRLNYWEKDGKGIDDIIADVTGLGDESVLPNTSRIEGLDLAKRLYYVTGWASTSGSKQKQQAIAWLSLSLSA